MGRTRGGLFSWAPHSLRPQPAGPCPVLSCLPRALPRWLTGQVHPLHIDQVFGSLALRPSQKPAARSHERHWAWGPLLLRLPRGAALSLQGLGAEPLQRCLLLLGAFFPRVPASLCPHQPPEVRGPPRTNVSSPACLLSALPPLFSSDEIAPIPPSALQAHVSPWGATPTQRPPLPVLPTSQAHPLCGWVPSLFQAPGAYSSLSASHCHWPLLRHPALGRETPCLKPSCQVSQGPETGPHPLWVPTSLPRGPCPLFTTKRTASLV